jgi:hypothetical protein
MQYNNYGFPVNYQQQYQQFQQTMTPPIVHADIIQVNGEQDAAAYPVAAGASQMMIARDESAIFVKTAYANGQTGMEVFVRRKQQPQKEDKYITRDELEQRLAELMAAKEETKP